MANIASDHIKPCNIGQSEAHNRRTPEYLSRINKDKIYIRQDLMANNESWIAPELSGMDLQAYYELIARMVKEKTGRALQTKERTRTNKKTGKTVKVNGSSPIRESVIVCRGDTSLEDVKRYCNACHDKWGITALQVHIHRDEGHYQNPNDQSTWKPNFHAHIVWDWMNHETGKSCKLGKVDMSIMQDMVAEALGMERGKSKAETGREHLERTDFIIAKQKQEAEQAKAEKEAAIAERDAVIQETDKAKSEQDKIQRENEAKKQYAAELDSEIAEKQRKANSESGNAILAGIANIAGRGKYAEIAKENERLKASLTETQKEFADKYNDLAKKHNAQLSARKKVEAELMGYKQGETERINSAVREAVEKQKETIGILNRELHRKSALLNMLADLLYRASDVFQRAIAAIIDFATSKYKSVFSPSEAADIKQVMRSYGGEDTPQQKAIGSWLCDYAESRQPFEETKHRQTYKEVADVADGAYDWKIERRQNELQR